MTEIQLYAQAAMESLNKSVREALDKKRKLGQYAVIWKDDKVVYLFGEDLKCDQQSNSNA